jgi:twinkle protein
VASEGLSLIRDLDYIPLSKRGLTQDTCKRFGYGINDGNQVAPYYDDKGALVAQKVRGPNKRFQVRGDLTNARLFGAPMARKGGKRITICEGEIDAMSCHQAMGGTWPALSVPNGAAGAYKAIKENLDILEGYDVTVLCFDKDEPGQEAVAKIVELFAPGKVAIADTGAHKDANDMLLADGPKALRSALWDAREYRPDGVINMSEIQARVKKPLTMGISYPWAGLNAKLYGSRPGEVIVWTAGTGTGKTAVVSELVYSLIQADVPTGIIYLEEGVERAGRRICGLHMNKPLHLPDVEFTNEEFDAAWAETLGRGNLFAYEHFGSLDADVLLNRIRYMTKAHGVRVIVLDHVSMVVSGQELDTDERRMLDRIMTNIKSIAMETGCTMHVVSHLRRPQGKGHEEGREVSISDLRGTQAIGQLSDAVIGLERNQQAEDEDERNTTKLRILKNRYSGITGPAGDLYFNPETGRLQDQWESDDDTDF